MKREDLWLERRVLAERVRRDFGRVAFVSVNPDLKNAYGHFRPYERQLQHHVEQLGGQYYCLMSSEGPTEWGARYIPTFARDSGYYALMNASGRKDEGQTVREFCDELQLGLAQIRRDNPDITRVVAFVYCGSSRLAARLAEVAFDDSVVLTINGFWDFLDTKFQETAQSLGRCKFSRAVRLLACSFRETDILLETSGLLFPWIPNPAPGLSDADVTNILARAYRAPSGAKPTLFLPTLPSAGKGASFVDEFLARADAATLSGFHLIVRDADGQREAKWRRQHGDRLSVEFLSKVVSDEAMAAAYRKADIILLPYEPEVFGFRTSGILVDALVYGAVPIVLKDTWLAAVCEQTGSGVVIDKLTVDGLSHELGTIRTRLEDLKRASRKAAYRYCGENNWATLLHAVVEPHRAYLDALDPAYRAALESEQAAAAKPVTAPAVGAGLGEISRKFGLVAAAARADLARAPIAAGQPKAKG